MQTQDSNPIDKLQRHIDRSEIKAQSETADILRPSVAILCALASGISHAEEFLSPGRHHFDIEAFNQAVNQPHVREWLDAMTKAGFSSVKR
jgi:hypothetical protein